MAYKLLSPLALLALVALLQPAFAVRPRPPTAAVAPQDTRVLKAVADTEVDEGVPDQNWGDWPDMQVGFHSGFGRLRSLVQFDLSTISSDAPVVSAALQVFYFNERPVDPAPMTVTAYRVTSPWTEMEASWNNIGEAYAEAYGSVGLPASSATRGEWASLDVSKLVRAWQAGTYANHGLMLRGQEEAIDYKYFRTREGPDPAYGPLLVVKLGEAGIKYWAGSEGPDWHTAANWMPEGVPSATDTVVIFDVTQSLVVLAEDAAVEALTIEPGAALDLMTRTLTAERALTNKGTLRQTRTAVTGELAPYLRIANAANDQTQYHGLDLTLTDPGPAAEADADVQVSIAGGQLCPGRTSGVLRCYEIESTAALSATVRFYFEGSEQNGLVHDSLQVYPMDGDGQALPGPYSYGGSGQALYVEAQDVPLPGLFALDGEPDESYNLYLPLMAR
jgi:hypothetical protein